MSIPSDNRPVVRFFQRPYGTARATLTKSTMARDEAEPRVDFKRAEAGFSEVAPSSPKGETCPTPQTRHSLASTRSINVQSWQSHRLKSKVEIIIEMMTSVRCIIIA